MIPAFAVVGFSNSGKTTLVEKLIAEFKKRGYRVGTIKHHHQNNIEVDKPGKDTWRHAQAGADQVVLASPRLIASFEKTAQEYELEDILKKINNVDIVIVEGYKKSRLPKVEVFRSAVHHELITPEEELLAIASDIPIYSNVPCYDLNNPMDLASYIEEKLTPEKKENGHFTEKI